MKISEKTDLISSFFHCFLAFNLYSISILLLCYTQISNLPTDLSKNASQSSLDSAELEISMTSRDIINFMTGVDSLPEYLQTDLHIRFLRSKLASIQSKFSKTSLTVTMEDSIKYTEMYTRLMDYSDWNKDLLEYKHSADYTQDIIDHIYLCYTPYNFKVKGDKLRSIKKMFIAIDELSKQEAKKMSREEIKKKIVKSFEDRQFGNYKPGLNSQRIYQRVSIMNKIYGNPRILFTYNYDSVMSYGQRAYYEAESNTMYLGVHPKEDLYYYLNDWVAELAHSAQFFKIHSSETMTVRQSNEMRYIDSVICTDNSLEYGPPVHTQKLASKKTEEDLRNDAYETMYKKEEEIYGFQSIEHEAHYKIEPMLIREYKGVKRNFAP